MKEDLEHIFQGGISEISVARNVSSSPIYTMGGYSPVNFNQIAGCQIQFLLHRSHYQTVVENPIDPIHALEGITNYGYVTGVSSYVHTSSIGIVYIVTITVGDLELFEQDIKDFKWKQFEAEFTAQLEEKLD